jgi:hypothetical protein
VRDYYISGLNRTVCDVLGEMRKLYETRNFSALLGLIEEAQIMASRMESKLYTMKDIDYAEEIKAKLKKEIKELENKKEEITNAKV